MSQAFVNREFWFLAPEIFLTVWGLLVLIADFGPLRDVPAARRNRVLGMMSLAGAVITLFIGYMALMESVEMFGTEVFKPLALNLTQADYSLFSGTLAADSSTAFLNLVVVALLAMVIGISMSWNFTEHVGEYYSLLLWTAVAMMFLIAAEELLTLFLTLETMTLGLYMMAALEKSKRRSAEAGLKYFVYGSVSSALFLFGLSLIYGLTGTTTLAGIQAALSLGGSFGLQSNIAGATAFLLVMVGLGFKIAAVPFHQWAPDTYEGAPAPVTAWIAAGSKIASFVAMMKILLNALPSWSSGSPVGLAAENFSTPGWIGVVAVVSAVTMTYGNFAALAQKNFKRMLAYSSIAHAGYMLVGVLAAAVSIKKGQAAGAVLFYLVVYGFSTVGALAVAAWMARDKGTDEISDLNGLGRTSPMLAVCIVLLMLSLIGMPPLGGFFGKLYMFMEAMNSGERGRLTLQWLVMLGLFNSVVSAFYYVRVLKAMFLRPSEGEPLKPAASGVTWAIVISTLVAVGFGLYPEPLVETMRSSALPMLTSGSRITTNRDYDAERLKDYQKQRSEKIRDLREQLRKKDAGPAMAPPAKPGEGNLSSR